MPDFEIFDLNAGGGVLGICQMPGRGGDFASDLRVIASWRPNFVISVVQVPELLAAKADRIEHEVQELRAQWRLFPVMDYGVPCADTQVSWPALAQEAADCLQSKGRVLVHCQGGCGRSGMVLLRLMIMYGEPPEAALERLRRVRPCAVETEGQRAWAATGG